MYKIFFYLSSFALSRGGVFVAPIILANILSAEEYGTLEVSHAIASALALFLALGMASAVPLALIRKIRTVCWSSIILHHFASSLLLMLVGGVALAIGIDFKYGLAFFLCAILMNQTLWSVVFKSRGNKEASLVIDGGFWFVSLLSAMISIYAGRQFGEAWLFVIVGLVLYLIYFVGYSAVGTARCSFSDSTRLYFSTLRVALPLMVAAMLTFLVTTSGRLGVGLLFPVEVAADYAVLFRATALPIVAHQVAVVYIFKNLFELDGAVLEKRLLLAVCSVITVSILFWILVFDFGFLLGHVFYETMKSEREIGMLILFQCILWSGVAVNDLVATRKMISNGVNRCTLAYLFFFIPLLLLLLRADYFSLYFFVLFHSLLMLGYFIVQSFAMYRQGVVLARIWISVITSFVFLNLVSQLIIV